MERRFEVRRCELLKDAQLKAPLCDGMLERLEAFVEPFTATLARRELRVHAQHYVGGLLSDLERKNAESIAYRYDQDRRGIQQFLGGSPWGHEPLERQLVHQVGTTLGEPDAVIVFDPSGHKKCGHDSVGVQRQWLGRLGKVENSQVGIYMGYASCQEYALVATRLYLPKSWVHDRKRRRKCAVPKGLRYQTRHKLALAMLATHGSELPHGWIAGDDEMGHSTAFRRDLRCLGERYLLAVPSNTNVRDLEGPLPAYKGLGRRPKGTFGRVDRWAASLDPKDWSRVEVRDGEKGPLEVEILKRRVLARTERGRDAGAEELLVVTRYREHTGTMKVDYHLSNAHADTPLGELARVTKAEHRIEDGLKRAKSEAGLSDYEVRTWVGWYHHQVLSLMAVWFLILEARRGKKVHSGHNGTVDSGVTGLSLGRGLGSSVSGLGQAVRTAKNHPQGIGPLLPLQETQPLGSIAI